MAKLASIHLLLFVSVTYRAPWLGVLLCFLAHQPLISAPGWAAPLLLSASGTEMATHVGVLFCCLVHQAVKGPTWLGPSLLLDVSGA